MSSKLNSDEIITLVCCGSGAIKLRQAIYISFTFPLYIPIDK